MGEDKGYLRIWIAVTLFLVGSILLSGCASQKLSKSSVKELVNSIDYYEYVETNKSPMGHTITADILPCFDVEESEFKNIFNSIIVMCWARELENAPETIDLNSSEYKTMQNSVGVCAYTNLIKELKDNFTFDKSPDRVDDCKKIYDKIRVLK